MFSTSPSRLAALLAVCLCVAIAAPSAHAKDDESADAHAEASVRFRRGVKLYKGGDHEAALIEFKRAYELEPNYVVLYNLGQTSRELKDYASALVAYRRYLDEGGKEIGASRKKEVEGVLEDLTDRVGTLRVTTNVEGAEIQIDDEVVGVTPLDQPVVVNIGKRRVSATLTGHAPVRRVIEVAGRDSLDVKLELADLRRDDSPGVPAPAPSSSTSGDDEQSLPIPGIVALSITAACGIASGVLGGLALAASGDRDDALSAFPGNRQTIDAAKRRTDKLATATDVMLGVTAAGAITTLVLFLVNPGADANDDGSEDAKQDEGVRFSVTPSFDGVWVTGTF